MYRSMNTIISLVSSSFSDEQDDQMNENDPYNKAVICLDRTL